MSSVWSLLLAANDQGKLGTWNSPVLWTVLTLVGVLLAAALIVTVVDRWRKRSRQDRSQTGDHLSHFRSLYDRGELSREEFERIRGKLGSKLRQEMQVPAAKPESPVKPDASAKTEPPPAVEPPQPPEPPANDMPNV